MTKSNAGQPARCPKHLTPLALLLAGGVFLIHCNRHRVADGLVAQYFKPWPNKTVQFLRADDQLPPYEAFFFNYNDGRWAKALEQYDKVPDSLRSPDLHFFRANALLETGDASGAAAELKPLLDSQASHFTAEAGWYLALALLRAGETAACRKELEKIAGDPNSYFQVKATSLLKQLPR